MPVTIRPAAHGANPFQGGQPAGNALQLLQHTSFKEHKKVKNQNILESSFQNITSESNVYGRSNGFVDSAITAYNAHHHLEIRPDDVWFSILGQLNIYINEHSEELRDMFVDHKGQKDLQIEVDRDLWGTGAFGVDWAKFAIRMTGMIDENIKDRELRDWILPQFTTTTKTDTAVASILMMAAMKKYFTFSACMSCGLPSVTLLGQKSDWERLITLAQRLPSFGAEPTQWYGLLKPVLARFVTSFDAPEAEETKDFWQKIAHYSNGGSGPTYLSGWITTFCFWSGQGECFYKPGNILTLNSRSYSPSPYLQLDEAVFHRVESTDVPPGWASVPVMVYDKRTTPITKMPCTMVAGSVGMRLKSSAEPHNQGEPDATLTSLDTITIESGWWMYEGMTEEDIELQKQSEIKTYGRAYAEMMWE